MTVYGGQRFGESWAAMEYQRLLMLHGGVETKNEVVDGIRYRVIEWCGGKHLFVTREKQDGRQSGERVSHISTTTEGA